MTDDQPTPRRLTFTTTLASLKSAAAPLGESTEWVRGFVTFVLMTGYLWMQWQSPRDGAVPLGLVGLVGIATGFYLTHPDASMLMKALLAVIYVVALVAFYLMHNWAPAEIIGQVTIIVGILFSPNGATVKNGA